MCPSKLLHILAVFLSVRPLLAVPSIVNEDLNGQLLPFGASVINSDSDHLAVRGVVGGRKKRYVIERDEERRCCRQKQCLSLKAEFLDKDCKCNKCPKCE